MEKPGLDSHTEIMAAFGIASNREDGQNFVPIEVYPADWTDIAAPDAYILHIDMPYYDIPGWFDAERQDAAEIAMRRAVGRMLKGAGLKVGGNLNLYGCAGLKSLPAGLKVGGYLYLSGCKGMKFLPAGLKVGVNIYLGADMNRIVVPRALRRKLASLRGKLA